VYLTNSLHQHQVRYLGVFDSKVEAAAAYDAAMLQEAVKKGTTASRLPEKRFVLRSCQKHYAVESVNSPKFRPCEQVPSERAKRASCSNTRRGGRGPFEHPYLAKERSERAVRTPAGETTRHIRMQRFALGCRHLVWSLSDEPFKHPQGPPEILRTPRRGHHLMTCDADEQRQ